MNFKEKQSHIKIEDSYWTNGLLCGFGRAKLGGGSVEKQNELNAVLKRWERGVVVMVESTGVRTNKMGGRGGIKIKHKEYFMRNARKGSVVLHIYMCVCGCRRATA